jgi:hypothetical protein
MFFSDRSSFALYIKKNYPNQSFEIIKTFERPHVGWEMDNECVVVKLPTKIILLGTNHGGVFEMDKAELQSMIDELQEWMANALHAATLICDETVKDFNNINQESNSEI